MNYYEETLHRLKQLVSEQKYDEALKLVNEELSMPYVPAEFANQLTEIRNTALSHVNQPTTKLTGEQIFEILNNEQLGLDEKVGLFPQLEKLNLRNFFPAIEVFLNHQNPNELKTMLLYAMMNQEIDHDFHFQSNETIIDFNPHKFDFQKAEQVPLELNAFLEANLPQDYIQLFEMGKMVVANFYYKLFPLVQNYDLPKLGQAMINRLLVANGIEAQPSTDFDVLAYEKLLSKLQIV